MKQLLQRLDTGESTLIEVPVPKAGATQILVETRATVISAGTERMLVDFGRAGLIEKARSQPDKVKAVLDKMRTDGVGPTLEAVRAKLGAPIPLGYCQAGVVVEVGSSVTGFAAGDRVVTNGSHAEYVRVPPLLAARIPEGVGFEAAAFTPLAAIGLQGIRLAAPTLGETVVVYGLGLIGLLTVQLLRANGCRVIGIDRDTTRLALAERFGAITLDGTQGNSAARVLALTGHVGADAVLLTLASGSDEPVQAAAEMSRKRGRLVLVGVTGLALSRDAFYKKELSFTVSCSYGPGRYDPRYEEQGQDYPIGHVRWTEQRNFEAVLRLMADGQVNPAPLITHRYAFKEAPAAYDLITSDAPNLGVVLTYPDRGGLAPAPAARVLTRVTATPGGVGGIAMIGAGNFALRTLLPALRAQGARLRTIVSSGGASAVVGAEKFGFEQVTTDAQVALDDPAVESVFILTRHDSHAALAQRALAAGKHVFVEKPLALTEAELDQLEARVGAGDRLLTVGFNRRFAPLSDAMRNLLAGRAGPLATVLTMNAGAIPRDHWTQDPAVGGGRIVGEACHLLDLARALTGAPITGVRTVPAQSAGGQLVDDIAHLTVTFADGSTAVVHYLANGAREFPKERVECFFDGKVVVLDNWRRLLRYGMNRQLFAPKGAIDKGHDAEVAAWLRAVKAGGPPPIPLDELFEVSRWAIRAGLEARGTGAGALG